MRSWRPLIITQKFSVSVFLLSNRSLSFLLWKDNILESHPSCPNVIFSAAHVFVEAGADPGGGHKGCTPPPPIFGLAVPNLSPTLHARTPMTPPAPPLFSNPGSAPVKCMCSTGNYHFSAARYKAASLAEMSQLALQSRLWMENVLRRWPVNWWVGLTGSLAWTLLWITCWPLAGSVVNRTWPRRRSHSTGSW